MIVGIRGHDLGPKGTIGDLIDRAKANRFNHLQLVFKKTFIDYPIFNEENAKAVASILKNNDIEVSMLGAYFNPVHSNKVLVRQNIEYFKEHLRFAHLFNCKYVGTETGSYNDDKWTYNPKNQTEEGYQETMSVFHELIKVAEENKATILMEPAWGHIIYSIDQLKRAYDEINSPNLKVTIDIYNLLYIGNYKDYKEIYLKALTTFGENIKILHLKDFYVEGDKLIQCGLGKGIIDFEFIVANAKKYCPEATFIFEGVTGADISSSHELINKLL